MKKNIKKILALASVVAMMSTCCIMNTSADETETIGSSSTDENSTIINGVDTSNFPDGLCDEAYYDYNVKLTEICIADGLSVEDINYLFTSDIESLGYPWLNANGFNNPFVTDATQLFSYKDGSLMKSYEYLYYVIVDDEAWITGYTNDIQGLETVVIPNEIDGYPVTTITSQAFCMTSILSSMKYLILPNSITHLDNINTQTDLYTTVAGYQEEHQDCSYITRVDSKSSNLEIILVLPDTAKYQAKLNEMIKKQNQDLSSLQHQVTEYAWKLQNEPVYGDDTYKGDWLDGILYVPTEEELQSVDISSYVIKCVEVYQDSNNPIIDDNSVLNQHYIWKDTYVEVSNNFYDSNQTITYNADVNNDGNSSSNDLLILKKVLLGTYQEDTSTLNTDINQDGNTNSADLLCLKKINLGLL